MILNNKIAVDTNILYYLFDDRDIFKNNIALEIVSHKPNVSHQTVSEFLCLLKKKIYLN